MSIFSIHRRSPEERAVRLVAKAGNMINSNRLEAALRLAERAIELDPSVRGAYEVKATALGKMSLEEGRKGNIYGKGGAGSLKKKAAASFRIAAKMGSDSAARRLSDMGMPVTDEGEVVDRKGRAEGPRSTAQGPKTMETPSRDRTLETRAKKAEYHLALELVGKGNTLSKTDNHHAAMAAFDEAKEHFLRLGDTVGIELVLDNLFYACCQVNSPRVNQVGEEWLKSRRALFGSTSTEVALALNKLGLALEPGSQSSLKYFEEALQIAEQLYDPDSEELSVLRKNVDAARSEVTEKLAGENHPTTNLDDGSRQTLCTNCGCGNRIPISMVDTLIGSTCYCHCGHTFTVTLYGEIVQLESLDWPDRCENNDPRVSSNPTYFVTEDGERVS